MRKFDEDLKDKVQTLIPSLKRIYKTQEEILHQGMQRGLSPHQEQMMRSILHTLKGLSIRGSRIKELMFTDNYHQGEKMECKAKTYLQNSGRLTSPQSTQDCEDQESEEGDQSYEDSQRSTYDSDQDCQQHDAEDGSQDILQDEDEYDYQGHEDGSQDIPQDNDGDHDVQDIDDDNDSRYYKFIKDILHEDGDEDQQEEDDQQDTHDEDEDC